jgi:tetratricopeptide (TPR) repeat protein
LDRKEREHGKDGKATAEAVSHGVSPEGREASPPKTELLFRQGEDLYALGLYQQAIHVWTRILFLERGHHRAKAAIERAKRAVSERQRELDAELATAIATLETGDVEAAAARVRHVLSLDPRHDEAHQLTERIAALRRRNEPTASSRAVSDETEPPASKRGLLLRVSRASSRPLSRTTNASPLKMAGFALGVILVFASGGLYLYLNWESIVSDGAFVTGNALSPPGDAPAVDASPPGVSELHYYNGSRLYAKGYYRRALAELSRVRRDDAVFERARSLILRIEERLLRAGELPGETSTPVEPAR